MKGSKRLGLKAVTGPNSAEATEITEWSGPNLRKSTGNYDLPIPGFSAVTGKVEKSTIYFIFTHHRF